MTTAAQIRLGPFVLSRPLASGGMGQVWGGTHTASGHPVAVKVLTHRRARQPHVVDAFKREVRAVAGLSHPHIISVFDYGRVDAWAERRSEGQLVAKSPYLVMELASHGSLERIRGRQLSWPQARGILRGLLDALSHAHARGVVHRDLKPGNVLLCTEPDGRMTIRLADFGLAHALDGLEQVQPAQVRAFSGTPLYMAPEQFHGRWRDYGPWTDLYALGCLAYELLSGAPPFLDRDPEALARAHVHEPAPPLEGRVEAPRGLDVWLRLLMDKRPEGRFQRAADAAYALIQLDPGQRYEEGLALSADDAEIGAVNVHLETTWCFDDAPLSPVVELLGQAREAPTDLTRGDSAEILSAVAPDPSDADPALRRTDRYRAPQAPPAPAPPMTLHWKRPRTRRAAVDLLGAGLGLYGLRRVPMVDRVAERDALWSALAAVHADRTPLVRVLRGSAGVGKTRLAEWLVRRAHEVGAANPLIARFRPGETAASAWALMLARELGTLGMDRVLLERRVERRLRRDGVSEGWEWLALCELVHPATPEDVAAGAQVVHFAKRREKHAVILGHAARMARQRPVIVFLDDVQWCPAALELVEQALDRRRAQLPLLFVMTVEEEAARAEGCVQRLERLEARREVERIAVPPLSADAQRELVDSLLGLEPDVALRVVERTAGNPLFAVQLIGEWVAQRALTLGESGFAPSGAVEEALPADLEATWRRHLELLWGHESSPAIELAATLGLEVDPREWRQVCDLAGVGIPQALVDQLVARRLAVPTERSASGWHFVHAMLREAVLEGARRAGRLQSHHRLCARMLEGRRGFGIAERRGRHLARAGALEEALGPLLEAARERLERGDLSVAEGLLAERERALGELSLSVADPRWGEGWVLQARAARLMANYADAEQWSSLARRGAAEHPGWEAVEAQSLLGDAQLAKVRGQLEEARGLMLAAEERAASLAGPLADGTSAEAFRARLRMNLGWLHNWTGEWERAAACFEAAKRDATSASHVHLQAAATLGWAVVAEARGALGETEASIGEARDLFARCGSRSGIARCDNSLGELERKRGNLERAAACYREALRVGELIGAADTHVAQMNLGLVLAEAGRYEDARGMLEGALRKAEAQARRHLAAAVRVFLAWCAAGLGEWGRAGELLEVAGPDLAATGFVEQDVATSAERAGELASQARVPETARRAWELSLAQWEGLSRHEDAARLRRLLGR